MLRLRPFVLPPRLLAAPWLVVTLLLVAAGAVVGCERPVVEAARPLFRVVTPDPTEVRTSTRERLRLEATSFRAIDSVRAAGQLLTRVTPTVFEGTLTLATGLNRIPLEAVDAEGVVGRDTLVLFVLQPVVTSGPVMPEPRTGHAATLLADERVLLTGGAATAGGVASDLAFVLNPGTSRFERLDARMPEGRTGHTATRLPDGRVLLVGGARRDGATAIADLVEPVVVFDPRTNAFSALPVTGAPVRNTRHAAWAVAVAGETRLYVLGGEGDVAYGAAPRFGTRSDLRTFQILPAGVEAVGVGASGGVGLLFESLAGHTATPLTPDIGAPRRVVVAGARAQGAIAEGVGFTIAVGADGRLSETTAASPQLPRIDHASALLAPGVVGVFGGRQVGSGAVTDRVELYLAAADRYVVVPASSARVGRAGASATFLGTGRILVVGGLPPGGGTLATSSLFSYDL